MISSFEMIQCWDDWRVVGSNSQDARNAKQEDHHEGTVVSISGGFAVLAVTFGYTYREHNGSYKKTAREVL